MRPHACQSAGAWSPDFAQPWSGHGRRLEYPADFKFQWFRAERCAADGLPPTVRPALKVRDQAPLRAGVAVDVAFRRFDRTMPREQLHVT